MASVDELLERRILDVQDSFTLTIFVTTGLTALVITAILVRLNLPHQLIAIVLGGLLGAMCVYIPSLHQVQMHFWRPNFILMIVHPIMILKLAYGTDVFVFMKSLGQITIITLIGTVGFTLAFGFLVIVFTGGAITFPNCMAAGTSLAAIDVPDIIIDLNKVKNLEVIMNGESIFGTAFCLITFELCSGFYYNIVTEWHQVICYYIRSIMLAVIFGIIIGKAISLLFRHVYNDAFNAITTLVSSCYITYILFEMIVWCSGAIGTFIVAFILTQERSALTQEVDSKVHNFLNVTYNTVELLNSIMLSVYVIVLMMPSYVGFEFAIAIGVYIIGNVLRLLIFIMLTPILSRMGYGFDFTTMFTICWAAKRGSLQLLQVISIHDANVTMHTGTQLLCFTLTFLVLTFLINVTTLEFILKKMGVIELSMARKMNITNCFKSVNNKKKRILSHMKMNRFYSDANWPLIQKATNLQNPFESETIGLGDDAYLWIKEDTRCTICFTSIPIEPNKKEMRDMKKEAKIRILKAERISYVNQYEQGYLNKREMQTMLQAVEVAMNSNDLEMKLEDLQQLFADHPFFMFIKNFLLQLRLDDFYDIPLTKVKRTCYLIATSKPFEYVIYTVVVLDFCATVSILSFALYKDYLQTPYLSVICLTYLAEFFIKLLAYSRYTVWNGISKYFRHYWNIFDFIILCLNISVFGVSQNEAVDDTTYIILYTFKMLKVFILLKLLVKLQPQFVMVLEKKMDTRICYAFAIGKALVIAYENILDRLPQIADHDKIREEIRTKLDSNRLSIVRTLGLIAKDRPWIMTSVKTRQAITTTLKSMAFSVLHLKFAGFLDDFEYLKLNTSIEERWKVISTFRWLPPVSPKDLFEEIPWLCEDETVSTFLYENVLTKIWDAGEVICKEGDIIDGVYILIQGLFKMEYIPTEQYKEDLAHTGNLPVKDFLNERFSDPHQEYVMIGNSIGELCVLTGRPYCCKIISDVPSQAFIIPSKAIYQAFKISDDPVNGLASKMWKTISSTMVKNILSTKPLQQLSNYYDISFILHRGIVPNLAAFKILVLADVIEDIILIQGLVVDYNTREIFTAPCYIPRNVQRIMMPSSSAMALTGAEVRLMLVPLRGVDEYQLMLYMQKVSDLVANPPSNCLLTEETHMLKVHQKKYNTIFSVHSISKGFSTISSSRSMQHSYHKSMVTRTRSDRSNKTPTEVEYVEELRQEEVKVLDIVSSEKSTTCKILPRYHSLSKLPSHLDYSKWFNDAERARRQRKKDRQISLTDSTEFESTERIAGTMRAQEARRQQATFLGKLKSLTPSRKTTTEVQEDAEYLESPSDLTNKFIKMSITNEKESKRTGSSILVKRFSAERIVSLTEYSDYSESEDDEKSKVNKWLCKVCKAKRRSTKISHTRFHNVDSNEILSRTSLRTSKKKKICIMCGRNRIKTSDGKKSVKLSESNKEIVTYSLSAGSLITSKEKIDTDDDSSKTTYNKDKKYSTKRSVSFSDAKENRKITKRGVSFSNITDEKDPDKKITVRRKTIEEKLIHKPMLYTKTVSESAKSILNVSKDSLGLGKIHSGSGRSLTLDPDFQEDRRTSHELSVVTSDTSLESNEDDDTRSNKDYEDQDNTKKHTQP